MSDEGVVAAPRRDAEPELRPDRVPGATTATAERRGSGVGRRHQGRILANQQLGERYKVGSTPSFIIGGQLYAGSLAFDEIKRIVDSLAAIAPAPAAAPTDAPRSTPVGGAAAPLIAAAALADATQIIEGFVG